RALLARFDLRRYPPRGSKIRLVNWQLARDGVADSHVGSRHFFQGQELLESSEYEKSLYEIQTTNEVLHFRAFTSDGREIRAARTAVGEQEELSEEALQHQLRSIRQALGSE